MSTPDVLQRTSNLAADISLCGMCKEVFQNPKVLSCLHTFCYKCIDKYITENISTWDKSCFLCPTCETEIDLPSSPGNYSNYADSLQDDAFMAKVVEFQRAICEEKQCDICGRQNTTVPATQWCMDCNDALCLNCLNVHLHVKVTATHAVISLEEMRSLPLEAVMKKKNKASCDKHREFITLFCVDCREPLCVQCMAVSHRRCENVITVSDAMTSLTDVEDVMGKLQTMQASLVNSDGLGKTETLLDTSITTARHEIEYLSSTLCTKVKEQEQVMLKLLSEKETAAKRFLKERTEPRKAQMKMVKSADQRLGALLKYGSDVEILMSFNQVRKQLDHFDQSLGAFNPDRVQVKVEFVPNEPSLEFMENFKVLGDVIVDTGADEGISSWGVTCTSNDDIVVTDCKNRRIQKFSKYGELVDHIQLDDEPRDITTCGTTDDVAVTLIGRLIIFIATRKTLTLIKKAKTERQYDGISFSLAENYLVVSCVREKRVDIIQLDGEIIRSFSVDRSGEPLFQEPRYVSTSLDRTILVSDVGRNAVICLNHEGHPLFSYTAASERDLRRPQGVCVDKIGNVFVADNGNDRIQLLTSHGAFQRYVLVKDSGLERPCAIVVSHSNRLVIVQNDGMVKVYSYS